MDAKKYINQLFYPSGCITEKGVVKYITNKMPEDEIRFVNEHIDSCNLCREAIEGANSLEDADRFKGAVDEINKKIKSSKNFTDDERSKIIRLKRYKLISIAASILLLIGIAFLFNKNKQPNLSSNILSEQEIMQITKDYEIVQPTPPVLSKKTTQVNTDLSLKEENTRDVVLIIESPKNNLKQTISSEDLNKFNFPVSVLANITRGNEVVKVCFDEKGKLKEIDVVVSSEPQNGEIATVMPSPKKITNINKKELRRIRYSFPIIICQ